MDRRGLIFAALPVLSACGGIASVDLFFTVARPPQDGSTNLRVVVTEGSGAAPTVLEEVVQPFDLNFDLASVRLPFGTQRVITATLETDEERPRVLFAGRSAPFRLQESDGPILTITMSPVPSPGTLRVSGSQQGRVGTATVTLALGLDLAAVGVDLSEDPSFSPARTRSTPILNQRPADPRMPGEVLVDAVIGARCDDRTGCPRTIYARFVDFNGFHSDVFSTRLIYDPFPPRLLDVSLAIDTGAVLGGTRSARIAADFDEPVVLSTFAALSGGSPQCPDRVELVDGTIPALAFPIDCAGTYSIEITATDLAGNSVRLFDVATLAVDRTPPPPLALAAMHGTCAGSQPIVQGDPGAAEPRATVAAGAVHAVADDRGGFVLAVPAGEVELRPLDTAGNEGPIVSLEVLPCGG